MGREWERQDTAYACYSGFLHMEASKSNLFNFKLVQLIFFEIVINDLIVRKRILIVDYVWYQKEL